MKLFAGQIAQTALSLLLLCLGGAGQAVADEAPSQSTPSRVANGGSSWDDRHMRTRYPRYSGSGSSIPRLILPEGRNDTPLPEAKTIYATPDRSWESGTSGKGTPSPSSAAGSTLGSRGAIRSSAPRSSALRGTSMSTRR